MDRRRLALARNRYCRCALRACLTALVLFEPAPFPAEASAQSRAAKPSTYPVSQVQWENDFLVPAHRTDRNYTNGIRALWLVNRRDYKGGSSTSAGWAERKRPDLPIWYRPANWMSRHIHVNGKKFPHTLLGVAFGQNMTATPTTRIPSSRGGLPSP